ncbi:MAG: VCBS repeat-containing protein [Opitutaceae bacterium]|nr:VCBS repeat-containing protein [Opitutaceae bacterium]
MRALPLPVLLVVSLACAAPFASSAWAAPRAPVFSGPEVVKLDWNTRALVAHDLDGDGRSDLALINNDRAALELLYQRDPAAADGAGEERPRSPSALAPGRWEPRLEDARFRRETLIVGQNLFDLVAADFDGDGRIDLAATGEPAPLQIRFAREDGGWDEHLIATAPAPVRFLGGLAAQDVNADGLADLVMLGQKELAVFLQSADAGLVLDEKIPLGDDNAYGLLLTDFDGDGRVDISYLVPGGRESLRVRRQVAPGKFGPELAFALKTPRSPLVLVAGAEPPSRPAVASRRKRGGASAASFSAGAGPRSSSAAASPLFASALGASGQLEFTRLVAAEADDRWRGLAPRAFSPLAGARSPALYAVGDFDRDGGSDLAVAHAETAQVFFYLRGADGGYTLARRLPSLTDAKALGALAGAPGGPADRLLVLSGKENALAEIVLGEDGVARPPRALPLPGRLIAFASGVLREAAGDAPAVQGLALAAEEDGKRQLSLWTRAGADAPVRTGSLELKGLRTDPRALTLLDINQDGRADVLAAIPSAGVRVYLQQPDGSLADAADNPAYRPGLLGRPEAASAPLARADVDGDGREELLLAAENFLRALRIDANGELAIVAQFDARDPGAEVTTGFVLESDRAGVAPRVILHDRKAEQLLLLERRPDAPAHETVEVRGVARLEATGALRLAGPGGRRELVLFGRDRFWWMPEGGADFALHQEGAYASDLPETRHFYLQPGDFDGDGRSELVAVDIQANTLEVLARGAHGGWDPLLHFRVFETDPHYAGNRGSGQEPRETLVADVTGDGRADLVLLVHDRVLVYPQE